MNQTEYRDQILDDIERGQVTPVLTGHYDSGRDVYVTPPSATGTGWRNRETQGWLARALFDVEEVRMDRVLDVFAECAPVVAPVARDVPPSGSTRKTVVCTPTDLHVGKFGWKLETGNEYNIEETRRRLSESTFKVMEMITAQCIPDRFIVGIGSDWYHIDNARNETTNGTLQDTDGTFARIAREGAQLMVDYIEMLRAIAPVVLVNMAGNHDRCAAQLSAAFLGMMYRDADDVTVRDSLHPRQYILAGSSMIGMAHGDGAKHLDLPKLAAVEVPSMWGASKYRYFFHGHLHHVLQRESHGAQVIQMPSLAGTDSWHARKGFVGSRKQLAAYVIDDADGLVAQFYGVV